jgi:hypothetical protein
MDIIQYTKGDHFSVVQVQEIIYDFYHWTIERLINLYVRISITSSHSTQNLLLHNNP